jgi:hypothetical protein
MARSGAGLRASRRKLRLDKTKKDTHRKTNHKVLAPIDSGDLIGVTAGKRMTDYRPEYANIAAVIVSVYGSTPSELAKFFGVGGSIITMWLNRHSDFRDAVEDATKNCNVRVMERLFRQCMGYRYKVERLFYDGKVGKIVKGTYTEYARPETQAMIYWLKNRMPDKWQDKPLEGPAGEALSAELNKLFGQEVTPDAAIDTYNKLLEIEAEAVKVEPRSITFTPKRPKPEVERDRATDAELVQGPVGTD